MFLKINYIRKNIYVALLLLCSFVSLNAQEKPKEMFREESMRKFAISNTATPLEKGIVWTYNFGDIKVHAYETKDFFGTVVYLLEKDGKAMLMETPPITDNYEELINYILALGYNNIDVISSYHPIGATFYNTPKLKFNHVYSMKAAVDNYVSGPGSQSLPGMKARFGEVMDINVINPTDFLEEGECEVAGFKLILKSIDFAFSVEIPELNAVHLHMLGHDKHNLIFSYDFLDNYISLLKDFQQKGYDMYFSSHAEAETSGDVTIKLKYLNDFKQIAESSSNKKEFLEKMNEAYPNFGWPFYLQGSANFLFKE